uniref:Uncharacterized protein n=1 Tax=Arundo donax TaxID=35708 RepID=A0A0A8ZZL6_ARUDO
MGDCGSRGEGAELE